MNVIYSRTHLLKNGKNNGQKEERKTTFYISVLSSGLSESEYCPLLATVEHDTHKPAESSLFFKTTATTNTTVPIISESRVSETNMRQN